MQNKVNINRNYCPIKSQKTKGGIICTGEFPNWEKNQRNFNRLDSYPCKTVFG